MKRTNGILVLIVFTLAAGRLTSGAEDWPTYRHDNRRSGVTSESPRLPLQSRWIYAAPTRPQTAWPGPAKWDSYANIRDLKSMRNFDPAFYVTVVGNRVFFGSSVDDAVHCLDADTGAEQWVFFTDGPVRLPPTWYDHRLYFGSDDGWTYCIDADNASLIWKYRAHNDPRLVPSNGTLIPLWPCRTGVLLQNDTAYFAASLLPWRETWLCALDAHTGTVTGPGRYRLSHPHLTIQGALIASPTRLYISQGRQQPIVCDITNGRILGTFGRSGEGGVFALLTEDNTLFQGHGQNHGSRGELRTFAADSRDFIVKFPSATAIVATAGKAYLLAPGELSAFNRRRYLDLNRQRNQLLARQNQIRKQLKADAAKLTPQQKKELEDRINSLNTPIQALLAQMPDCFLWKVPCAFPHELILAGSTLFLGGDDTVAAFDAATGRQLWTAPVHGRAFGLVFAHGRLFVSTDEGKIHCFQ